LALLQEFLKYYCSVGLVTGVLKYYCFIGLVTGVFKILLFRWPCYVLFC